MTFSYKTKTWTGHIARMLLVLPLFIMAFFLLKEIVVCASSGCSGKSLFDILKVTIAAREWGQWFSIVILAVGSYCWFHGMGESKRVVREGLTKFFQEDAQTVLKVIAPIVIVLGVVVQQDPGAAITLILVGVICWWLRWLEARKPCLWVVVVVVTLYVFPLTLVAVSWWVVSFL